MRPCELGSPCSAYHTSPLARLGRTLDAGGMNVYIRGLAQRAGPCRRLRRYLHPSHSTAISPYPAACSSRPPHLPPRRTRQLLPPSELFPYVDEFTRRVAHFAECEQRPRYDLVHSHYWLSAVAGASLAEQWDVPHVTMFHTVELLKRQQYGGAATLTPASPSASSTRDASPARSTASSSPPSTSASSSPRSTGWPRGACASSPAASTSAPSPPARPPSAGGASAISPLTAGRCCSSSGGSTPSRTRLTPRKRRTDAHGRRAAHRRRRSRRRPRDRAAARGRGDLGIARRVPSPAPSPSATCRDYYRAADALAVTSRYESFGLAAVEALACGTPVVASQAGGLPSIVTRRRERPAGTLALPQAFAEQLDLLLEDTVLRERLSGAARSSVERFSWERIGDEVRALYQELTTDA